MAHIVFLIEVVHKKTKKATQKMSVHYIPQPMSHPLGDILTELAGKDCHTAACNAVKPGESLDCVSAKVVHFQILP